MRRVVVTPAGRRRYLELLYEHLRAQRDDFDSWELWLNTWNDEDVAYCEHLAASEPWITLVRRDDLIPNNPMIGENLVNFYRDQCQPGAAYLKLDDDIVYLGPGFVRSMFEFREAHPEPYLVYGNIVNNAIVSHLHYRAGNVAYPRIPGWSACDGVGWGDPAFAEAIHRAFLAAAESGNADKWKLPDWIVWPALDERVSINCCAWIGSPGPVPADDEKWMSVDHPRATGRTNVIHGAAICSHFAFFTQREHLDRTDVLSRYAALTPA